MGYERLWVIRGQFGCKLRFRETPEVWGKREYGLSGVWLRGTRLYVEIACFIVGNMDSIAREGSSCFEGREWNGVDAAECCKESDDLFPQDGMFKMPSLKGRKHHVP
jgi:hypothetical protein